MSAQQQLFEDHLGEPGFIVGAKKGMWGIVTDAPAPPEWPRALFWIAAAPRTDCPDRYYLMFQLTGYPETAPSATLWDPDKSERLENGLWPKGDSDFNLAFSPARAIGLYLPCDGTGRAGKEQSWKKNSPEYWWNSKSKIDFYLSQVHKYLNSNCYAGK